ncbi:MAG: cytochrome C6 [Leptolyngbya sp. SIO1D8]|nr:cytochrome C6 [Leptolyngbya sp. SIO1D8]
MRSRWFWLGCLIITLLAWLSLASPVQADTTSSEMAEALFSVQCAGCHAHGGNIVRRGKTLKQRALQRNKVDSVEAIAALITNGRGIMSAYGDRLSPEEVQVLANYVWDNAHNSWK